jgi:hypothetical protein
MPTPEFDTEYLYPDDPTGGVVLSVELQAENSTRLLAHVDTGAANCLFQSDYAELLGLTLIDGVPKSFSTAGGGTISAYGHQVTIKVLDHAVESIVYFTDHPQFKRNVLGGKGWLHHFKLGLIEYESKLYLGYQGR